ncbi:hypothetical protein E0H39_07140 [Rhizobium leguminosarum bv. viciae]|uniref:hypothetical protein n=1 Tax=Rhizobium leguminosarum TaxID=384 RepID=UPI00103EC84F|nr:hypothetical protein [Rhizobium leguminosarum]TBY65766.1 hypothetical protein E0H39_07140 [Rhizobium leguminosarum bv. viciae]
MKLDAHFLIVGDWFLDIHGPIVFDAGSNEISICVFCFCRAGSHSLRTSSHERLSDREQQAVIKRNMDRCLGEGVGDQTGLIRCTIDKMCCYTPSKKPDYTRIFDASTGKWLTGNAATTAIKRANRQE